MRDGWEIKKLGDIAESRIGLTYKPENVSETGTIVLRSGNIQNSALSFDDIVRVQCNIKESLFVQENDILMCSRNGSANLVGKVALIKDIKEPMSYGAFMTIIRSKYQNYLFAFFKSPAFRQQLTSAKTATINQITVKMLNDVEIPVPPLAEQEHIVAELDLLSGIIEKQKQQLKELDNLAQSIFYDMFGDPITNEMGLEVKKLGDIGKVVTGNTPSTKDDSNFSSSDYCFVKPSDISKENVSYIDDTEYYISSKAYQNSRKLPKGSVLTTCIGIIGKVGILGKNATCNQQINAIVLNDSCVAQYVAYMLFLMRNLLAEIANAPIVPIINKKEFSTVVVPIPPLTLQQEFAKKIEAIEKQKELIKQSLAETETLFNSRMDYYFN